MLNAVLNFYKKNTIRVIIFTVFIILACVASMFPIISPAILAIAIGMNIAIIYRVRKSQVMYICYFYILTYLLYLIPYFLFGLRISYYSKYQNMNIFSKALIVHSIFIAINFLFIKTIKNTSNKSISSKLVIRDNKWFFIIGLIALVLIIILGKSGDFIFSSGGYGVAYLNNNFKGLAINEYFLAVLLITYVYSGSGNKSKILLMAVSAVYALKNLALGGRVETLQLCILWFCLLWDNKFKNRIILLLGVIGYSAMSFYGMIRDNVTNMNFNSVFNFKEKYEAIGYIVSNQGEVFYTSSAFIGMIKDDTVGMLTRLKAFVGFIMRIFLPTRFTFPEGKTSDYLYNINKFGGGGLISVYFYFWLGILGTILISFFVVAIINNTYRSRNNYFILYSIMFFTTLPRWFAYDPISMVKLSLYALIIYLVSRYIDKFFKRRGHGNIFSSNDK